MISLNILSDLFGALEEHVKTVDTSSDSTPNLYPDFKVVRSEQNGIEPPYPYCSYKILTQKGLGLSTKDIDNPNPIEMTLEHSEEILGNISISFCSNSISPLDKIAWKALRWFRKLGIDTFEDLGISVSVDPSVTDRTAYLDSVQAYEVKLGFDIQVRVSDSFLEKVPAMDLEETLKRIQFILQ